MDSPSTYQLKRPCKQHMLDVYTKAFDDIRAKLIWREACDAVGKPYHADSLEEIEDIYRYLSDQTGKIGVYGMSLMVRLMTYKNLHLIAVRQTA